MIMEIEREMHEIKGGWASRSKALGLTAHGYSQEVADVNLERVVRLFLMPFQREGTLADETKALGLGAVDNLNAVEIVLT